MKYGYARVSTTSQELDVQINQLEKENCDVIFSEKFTGTKSDRPKFKELLSKLEAGDTLVVTKLDRFARNTKDAIEVIESLFKQGVKVHILNMGLIEDTPTGKLIFSIMSAFAQFERDMIVERTQEGKAIAKLNPDYTEGRKPKYSKKQIENAMSMLQTKSYKEVEDVTGISKSTLIRAVRKAKLKN